MRRTSLLVATLTAMWLTARPGAAADLKPTDSGLVKEPAYKGTPQYCLLLLGREAKTRIWLVFDGKTMYVDKNGNGDLTEPGEAMRAGDNSPSFNINAILDRDGSTKHTELHISVSAEDKERKQAASWFVQINVGDRYQQYAYVKKLASKPADAAVVHFGGPLKMYMWSKSLVRGDKPSELEVAVVTQYPGVVWAAVRDGKGVPKDIHPIAEIVFAGKAAQAKPITLRLPLKQRC